MRKSILACTVSVLMSPMASWALGMGDIRVNSTLNQALNAEIELHSVTKKDFDSLHVGLAPKKSYERVGLERSDYLSKFRFTIVQRGGKNYVTITTKQPFKEPFANFLIEATWGSGRILREYTMLIDPPEFVKMNAKPVTTAATAKSSQVKRAPKKVAKPLQSKPAPAKQETKTVKQTTDMVLTPEKEAAAPMTTKAVAETELVWGPTQKNDTLWSIANSMKPENISTQQMMMALLRDNPEAFTNNNINNLKAGYVLRIKDKSSLTQLSKSAANQQAKAQYESWQETRKQVVSTKSVVDRTDRSKAKQVSDGELKLVASGSKETTTTAKGTLAAEAQELKDKLALTGEQLESKTVENEELRERIKELEKILETKSSLVKLKDENLAALQKQKSLAEKERAETESQVTPDKDETPVVDAKSIEPTTTSADVKPAETVITDHVDASVELAKDEIAVKPEPTPVQKAQEVKPEPKPVKQTKPKPKPKPKPVKKPKPQPMPEEDILQQLTGEYLPYTAGGGAILIAILAWLGLRGRGKKENDFEESILDSKMDIEEESDFSLADDSDLVEPESSTQVVSNDNETSFLSDFSSEDMESLQPDDTEADPISEADVFMVYGRYPQAEELLKSALSQEPERLDFQMKLLEVYHGDNQKDAFAVQADVVRDALKAAHDDYELTSEWTKAKSWAEKLGVDIDMPDSFDEESFDEAPVDENVDSEDLNLEDAGDEIEEATDELSLDDLSDELSLDADEVNLDEEASEDMELSLDIPEEDTDLESLDTDIGDSLELDLVEGEGDLELDLEDNSIDFDTGLEETSDVEESNEPEEMLDFETDEDDSMKLEDTSLELEDTELDLEDTSLDTDDMNLELDDADTGLDIEEPVTDTIEDSSLAEAEDDLDLLDDDMDFDELDEDFPELDAVGTKLDLAKAYIDMGDMESASSILNEVIDEGNEEQKSQAQELLNQTT